ncbi:MAG: hypothetical protein KDC53_16585 [Saprospiraceae bacterium]|nr:hypothetical protein [Saprospiraceae bacterium]
MEENKIREILEKYWEGETSLEEEKELRSYFASSQVSDEFAPFIPLFTFFEQEQLVEMKSEITKPVAEKQGGKVINLRWAINVAASIAIFALMFLVNKQLKQEPNANQFAYEDTYQSPEEALKEVKLALLYVSEKMNKGVSTTAHSLEKMQPLDEIINVPDRR